MNECRKYRQEFTSVGQSSPPTLGRSMAILIRKKLSQLELQKPLSIVDVGCGLGSQMKLIAESLPDIFHSIYGIDWSPATIEFHQKDPTSIYREVRLCDSSSLPFKENEFDIALSMENLEHLYDDGSILSLREMKRIARYVIIATPLPSEVINLKWIYPELVEAILDPIPLTHRDFICLESAVHKSTIFPSSMVKAGFSLESNRHGIYFGKSKELEINHVEIVSINKIESQPSENYQGQYINVLARSASLNAQISNHELYRRPSLPIRHILRRYLLNFLIR